MKDIVIERLGAAGDGVAHGNYYPLTLPGERIEPGPPLRILTEAPARVTPPCRHFGTCGGCSVQHASDTFVADWKQELVRRALAAHGLTATYSPPAISPPHSRRRAVLSLRRTKKTVQMGFHARASDQVVDLQECLVLRPGFLALRPLLTQIGRLGASRKSILKVQVTESAAGWDLSATGGKPLDGPLRKDLAQAAHDVARLTWNGEPIVQRAPPVQQIGDAFVHPPPGAFLQATAEGAEALTAAVLEATAGAQRVLDLFSGIGTFALPLTARAQVHGVEGEAAMVDAMRDAWRQTPGLKALTVEARDLFRRPLVVAELTPFDAVVLDPPRAGAVAQVAALADSAVPVIASVSCNPVTFARDCATLNAAGYGIDWIQIVDQFRWTGHVELVAKLSRNAAPAR